MTKQEAINALNEGKKVTHRFFAPDEYIYKQENEIMDEDNIMLSSSFMDIRTGAHWENGWTEYKK